MAMEWTSRNIDRFKGDRSRLMIHGCSAGGVSISNHLTQPLSWPFFTAAAMESGNMYAFTDAVSMADAQAAYADLLDGFRCAGGTVVRVWPPGLASGNTAMRTIDLAPFGITPGTWNAQCWFRDPGGMGGSGFNLSDGAEVLITL